MSTTEWRGRDERLVHPRESRDGGVVLLRRTLDALEAVAKRGVDERVGRTGTSAKRVVSPRWTSVPRALSFSAGASERASRGQHDRA
jgi:hypothetical protein